mmetsp:Transcript_19007/g.27009  ORF Transcript_19007/g.27009 Transcript_19007/m.27009 type:complete len:396 (+) Transcript_19007:44-1231(+)
MNNNNDRHHKTAIGVLLAEVPKQQHKLAFCLVLLLCNVSHCLCFCIPTKVLISANSFQHPCAVISTTTTTNNRIVRSIATTNTNNEYESTATTVLQPKLIHKDIDSELVVSDADIKTLGKFKSSLTKIGMLTFITGMCVALPLTLFPINLLHRARILSTKQREYSSLRAGQLSAKWLLRLIPFTSVRIIHDTNNPEPVTEPSVWVCNHSSMIDVFILLATVRRGRPIKVVYWKGLEANPVSKILFQSCGFIPIDMADNGNGNENEYDKSSFKEFLKRSKKAFTDGFDLGVLPEGQLNPTPEKGLLSVYPGAYTLSKMSKMPIRMIALYGTHRLWHPLHGMKPTSRDVRVRIYTQPLTFSSSEEFTKTFETVVGFFGKNGHDSPELQQVLSAHEER